jgi:hypothetical protein
MNPARSLGEGEESECSLQEFFILALAEQKPLFQSGALMLPLVLEVCVRQEALTLKFAHHSSSRRRAITYGTSRTYAHLLRPVTVWAPFMGTN